MSPLNDQHFLQLLAGLNKAVASCGKPIEGNMFYEHHDPEFPNAKITDRFQAKRLNLLAACRNRQSILEIGINAGHSALWILHNNPQITYHGVDIYSHAYTHAAERFLKETFKDRVYFYQGDSVHMLPDIRARNHGIVFDVAHIDGLHTLDHCKTDTFNALSMSTEDSWIIIDDTDLNHIHEFYEGLVGDGILARESPNGWQQASQHAVGRPIHR